MVGLGRMGAGLSRRLAKAGHRVVGFDPAAAARNAVEGDGVETVATLPALAEALAAPRAVWVMVPAGPPVDQVLVDLTPALAPGDAVIDGGNSYYEDTLRRKESLEAAGLFLVDAGTSGGVWGLEEGFSLMVGGPVEVIDRLRPVFAALAPGPDRGWGRVGPTGAGHFVKMVHNGIEYGMMEAMAEGFSVLRAKKEFGLDLHEVADIWRYGSVIRSWLMDLASNVFAADPELDDIAPYVSDSGEGRWTVAEAIRLNVPAPVLALSLMERIESRDEAAFGDRLLAALRNQFGGHAVRREPTDH